jgi:hypothetical protein
MKTSLPNDQVQEVYTAEYYFAEIFLIVKITSHLLSLFESLRCVMQPPVQWDRVFPGGKAAGAWC